MATYDESLLKELVEASQALSPLEKKWIQHHLYKIPQGKKEKIFHELAREQTVRYDVNQQRIALNTEYLHRQTSAMNTYNETVGTINEQSLVHKLDQEMDGAFDLTTA